MREEFLASPHGSSALLKVLLHGKLLGEHFIAKGVLSEKKSVAQIKLPCMDCTKEHT